MARILFVEDDDVIASGLCYALEKEGYEVARCASCAEAEKAAQAADFDLAILDVSLPDGDGFGLLARLREKYPRLVALFLTAVDDEANTVRGLEMGAVDYIAKPFRLRELLARVKAALRRKATSGEEETLRLGDIAVLPGQARVYKAGQEVLLTPLEYRLLLTLLHNTGQVLTRTQLLADLWDAGGAYVTDNTLSVYIRRLREKLENYPDEPRYIHTVRGLGYRAGDGDAAQ